MQALFTFKLYVLLLYGAFGVTCLVLAGASPAALAPVGRRGFQGRDLGTFLIALPAALLLIVYARLGSMLLVEAASIAAIVFVLSRGRSTDPRTIAAGISSGTIVLSLAWWQMQPAATAPLPLAAFAAVLGALLLALSDPGRRGGRLVAVPIAIFAIAGVALVADLGAVGPSRLALLSLAHHWGAFIGPALQVRAGLVPFVDVPLQYGLGPTLAIATTCTGDDCWHNAHAIFAGTSLIDGLLVLAMALAATRRRGWIWQCGVTAAVFCAVFLWPGFPSDGNMLMAMPSASGIRFLPVTLVAALLFFDHPRAAAAVMIPAVLWSPESAAMSAVVFGVATTARLGFMRAAAATAALLTASYAALFLGHRLIYGLWIDPLALVEYVLHVPGPLPIDPFSDILVVAAALALGGWLIAKRAPTHEAARRDLVATILLFATTSYCLGRSHPNAICNLAPYLLLVAMRALDRDEAASVTARKATACAVSVAVAALAFSPWHTRPFAIPPVVDIHAVVADFPSLQPDVERLRKDIPRGLGIADFGPAKIRNAAETLWWTPMDPTSLWIYVPSERRRLYIARSAARLRRAGWAVIDSRQRDFLDDLATAYTISNRRDADGAAPAAGEPAHRFTIACFSPKPNVVPDPIGPSCPTPASGLQTAGEAKPIFSNF